MLSSWRQLYAINANSVFVTQEYSKRLQLCRTQKVFANLRVR